MSMSTIRLDVTVPGVYCGWPGETSPCSGFGQYASETMFWAALSMAMPGLLGMLLGVAILIVVLIRRGMSRPAA